MVRSSAESLYSADPHTAMGLARPAVTPADGSHREEFHVRTALAVMVAGSLGALLRYAIQTLIDPRSPALPWGTFLVNISGAFALGFLFTLLTERLGAEPWLRTAITVGFLGAYTTFSTLAFETVRLLDGGEWLAAAVNMTGSAVCGVLSVVGGIWLARWIA